MHAYVHAHVYPHVYAHVYAYVYARVCAVCIYVLGMCTRMSDSQVPLFRREGPYEPGLSSRLIACVAVRHGSFVCQLAIDLVLAALGVGVIEGRGRYSLGYGLSGAIHVYAYAYIFLDTRLSISKPGERQVCTDAVWWRTRGRKRKQQRKLQGRLGW